MAKTRNTKAKANKKRAPARKKLDTTQLVAIGVIVVAVVLVAWFSLSKNKGGTTTAKQYSAPPPMTIDMTKQYFATVKMENGGEFVIQLFPDKAPVTVNNFVFLNHLPSGVG
jgi:flagellar basal body-associated protein FliL